MYLKEQLRSPPMTRIKYGYQRNPRLSRLFGIIEPMIQRGAGRAVRIGLILILLQGLRLYAKDPTWLELSSEHFILFTDTDQTKAQRLLSDLETRASVFAQVFGKIPARQFPIEIFIFNNEQDFIDAAPKPQPEE